MLPAPYFHVVYTLPGPIADIAFHNKAVIYDILFKASAEATITIAADPKHLGARLGVTAVLHTWGSAMTHHPRVHMIIPGGGLSEDGTRWIACRPNFFLAVRVLSRLFRRLVLQMLIAAHEGGQLQFFGARVVFMDNPVAVGSLIHRNHAAFAQTDECLTTIAEMMPIPAGSTAASYATDDSRSTLDAGTDSSCRMGAAPSRSAMRRKPRAAGLSRWLVSAPW